MKVFTGKKQRFDLFVADNSDGWHFEIECDLPEVGAYLYIWDEKGVGVDDYLQDSVQICMEQAFEDYGVPFDSWIKVE